MKKLMACFISFALVACLLPCTSMAANSKLATPANVKAAASAKDAVTVSWSKVKGASNYQIYRASGTKFKKIGTSKGHSFVSKKLKKNKVYKFKVRAVKGREKSSFSDTVSSKAQVKSGKANVKKVKMSQTKLSLKVGDRKTLRAALFPSKLFSKRIIWTSSNPSVAAVSKGKVTAKSEGVCTISARAHNGLTSACKVTVAAKKQSISAAAKHGTYIGHEKNGVQEFLGISYAAPIERWKAPKDPNTTSKDVVVCDKWGPSCIQIDDSVEVASTWTQSEDCLDLNIWTKDIRTRNKPVMIFFHGGGNWRGGTYDPLYHGDNFTRNLYKGEDVCFVTVNFRLGIFGSLNLSGLEGYTDEYKDAINLTTLDEIQAMKWVHENIEAFGGDPDNVTILGQSAGSGAVSAFLSMKETHKYFKNAICESGNIFNRAISMKQSKKNAQIAFDIMNVKSVEELMALSDQEIRKNYQSDLHKALFKGNGTMQRVNDGSLIPQNGYKELLNGSASDINVLVLNTDGEKDYKATDWDIEPYKFPVTDPEVVLKNLRTIKNDQQDSGTFWSVLGNEEVLKEYNEQEKDPVKRAADLYNDTQFRMTNIFMADALAANNENTYMCYWTWAPDVDDVIAFSGEDAEVSPWGRAMHCIELTLAFNNPLGYTELDGDPAKLPAKLLESARETWYAFAKTGDPNNQTIGAAWKPYRPDSRMMMVVNKDASWSCQLDPKARDTEILSKVKPSAE